MSDKTAFVRHKKLTLTKDGKHFVVPATGSFFHVKEASSQFEMQFDDQGWFPFDQGLSFNLGPDREFTRLTFRSLNTEADTNLEFYVADAAVGDSRLTITHDPSRFQMVSVMDGQTVVKPGPVIIGGSNAIDFPGVGASGSGFGYRKNFIVQNLNDTLLLGLQAYDPTNSPAPVHVIRPLQSYTFGTSAKLMLENTNATPVPITVMEIFYPE